jgi:hypothetical protein
MPNDFSNNSINQTQIRTVRQQQVKTCETKLQEGKTAMINA